MTRSQTLYTVAVIPLGGLTALFVGLQLWVLAVISALLALGIFILIARARRREQADEAIAAAEEWDREQAGRDS